MFVSRQANTRSLAIKHTYTGSVFGRSIFPCLLLLGLGFLLFGRCANQGMPTGGPKDSIPPALLLTSPPMMGLNFTGKEVRLTFNEYITSDAVSEELVVSPPLTKRPSVRTKSRSLIVGFNEELKPDVTYSLDFKNSVTDFNEQNPLPGLRLLFSTGPVIDTLRVAGMVKDGERLDPKEKITVMLHGNTDDTAVYRSRPDYISRTDKRGLFLFDNVKPGKYRLYALDDANNNLGYDEGAEEFAFADSLVIPSALYVEDPDTLVSGADSLLVFGHTLFRPDPFYLRLFTENFFDQYLDKSIRDSRYKCIFVFNEPVSDTFHIRIRDKVSADWFMIEPNPGMDSLVVWITDTLVARMDTLNLVLEYFQHDSLDQKYLEKDSLTLIYTDKERPDSRRRRKEDEIPEIVQFQFSDNLKPAGFDLNQPVRIQAPEPIQDFDFRAVKLTKTEDTTHVPLNITITQDTSLFRTYRIDYAWEPETAYSLGIDSAAAINIYGVTSQKYQKQFITQKEDFYGRIILQAGPVVDPLIVHLLDNSNEERIVRTLNTSKSGDITFDFLAPAKYKVKVVFDQNNNGKWDPGNFREHLQPERVVYLPEIIKVRSNWDNTYRWDLKPDPTFRKVLTDKEEEELRLKKLKEQQTEEREEEPVYEDFNLGR